MAKNKGTIRKNIKELKKVNKELKELTAKIKSLKNKKLIVWKKVYPGVSIGIVDVIYTVPEEKAGPLMFVFEADLIKEKEVPKALKRKK